MDKTDNELVSLILNATNPTEKRRLQGMLYDRIIGQVYRKSLYMVHNKEIAKDLTHDIILKVFLKLDSFRGDSQFQQWVSAISFNHCLTYLEKKNKVKHEEIDLVYPELSSNDHEFEEKNLLENELNCLELVMDKISTHEKALLIMRYYDEMPIKEIASALNIGESAAKMRLLRIRESLSMLIEEEDCE